jgi:hypothetical protein
MLQFTLNPQLTAEAEARANCARVLQHSKEPQYDEYDRDYDQGVDPIAGLREV